MMLIGCSPTEPGCRDICAIWSLVRGTIATSAGGVVADAQVELRLMHDGPAVGAEITCQLDLNGEVDLVLTDDSGAFFELLQYVSIFPPECVEIRVIPPAGAGLAQRTDTVLVLWSLDEASAPVSDLYIVLTN